MSVQAKASVRLVGGNGLVTESPAMVDDNNIT
jgi:hypothetical protein